MTEVIIGGTLAGGIMVTIGLFDSMAAAQSYLDAAQQKDDDLAIAHIVAVMSPAPHAKFIDESR